MTDDRLDQLSQVEDADTTLRDNQHPVDEPIELSASDLVALDPDEADEHGEPEAEATLVIERSAIEEASKADATKEDLRHTAQNEAVDAMTAERSIPDELLNKSLRTQERRRVELSAPTEPADPEHGQKTLKFEAIGGPKTEKMQAVGTQPLPQIDGDPIEDDPEATAVRNTDGGVWLSLIHI